MYKSPLVVFILFALAMPGVSPSALAAQAKVAAPKDAPSQEVQAKDPPPSADEIQALIARTKSNLAYLPGGTFEMGDWGGPSGLPYDYEQDSKPLHKVSLDGFSMMKYKVSYPDFDLFTAAKGLPKVNTREIAKDYRLPDFPAGVSWYGAKAYCQWLGELTQLPFDLPTEAQWEYAARSGGKKLLYPTDTGDVVYGRNAPSYEQRKALAGERTALTLPIGKFPPNSAGIYGMGELAREWVNDWYDPKYYSYSPSINPTGPATGKHKAQRGCFGSIDFAGMVFMRGDAPPQRLDKTSTYHPESHTWTEVKFPYEGYSSLRADTFRCAIQKTTPVD